MPSGRLSQVVIRLGGATMKAKGWATSGACQHCRDLTSVWAHYSDHLVLVLKVLDDTLGKHIKEVTQKEVIGHVLDDVNLEV